MSKFFPYMHEGPRPLSALSRGERVITAGHLGHVATVLGLTFRGELSRHKSEVVRPISLWLHNPERSRLLVMQAQLVVSETNTAVADPNLFLAGLSPRGVEEFYLYHPAQGAVGLLRDKLSTSGRIGRLGVDTGVAVGLAEANSLTADIVGDSPQVTEAYKPVEPHEGQSLMWPGGALKEQIRLV